MTLSASEVQDSLELFEIKPGTKVRVEILKDLLPDPSTALFFGKAYKLDYRQLSDLLYRLFNTSVIQALLGEGDKHSTSLQHYIIDVVPAPELQAAGITEEQFISEEEPIFLAELWEQLEVEVADSIQKLIDSLDSVLATMQGKYGEMVFSTMAKLNKQRAGIIGTYEAQIVHPHVPNNLVIFDVSGSVSRETAEKIVDEVVSLAIKANATLAAVSDHTYFWEPGTFTSADVMAVAEFGGTHYETLAELLNQNWSTVVTIADYDSWGGVPDYLVENCQGSIEQVLDISLVNRTTFLAECVGRLAKKVRPLLVGNSPTVLRWDDSYTPYKDYVVYEDDEFYEDDEDDDF